MCVSSRIKKYLEDNGISQTFVADRSGIPVVKLNQSLNGNRKISIDEYAAICGALSVSVNKFITANDEDEDESEEAERKAN